MVSDIEIMNKGIRCLLEKLGVVETERFIAVINKEKFDYTKWQRDYFDAKTPEEISAEASRFEAAQPFAGKAVRL